MDSDPTKNEDTASAGGATEGAAPAEAASEDAAPEDFRAKYLYASAEIENTKRRMQRRADDAAQAVRRRVLLRFLPVLDNLERALAYDDSGELRAGLDATLRGFAAALESEGVRPVETTGRRFDPNVAEAIAAQPANGVEDETVLSEAQRGYLLDDLLLRPARVVVAKKPPA